MKYILMMNTMKAGHGVPELAEEGSAGAHRLYDGVQQRAARTWRIGVGGRAVVSRSGEAGAAGKDGRPVTDGVFPESKEFLAGFWIIDVDSPQRAYEIAAKASAAPGPGGAPLNMPIEVRQVMSGPPPDML